MSKGKHYSHLSCLAVSTFGKIVETSPANPRRSDDNDDKYVNNKFASVQHSFQLLLKPAAGEAVAVAAAARSSNYYN